MISFIKFLIITVISYLGLFIGNLLIFFAPEELEPGRFFLRHLFYILFSSTFFVALYMSSINVALAVAMSLIIYFMLILSYTKSKHVSKIIMPMLAVLLGISSVDMRTFMSVAGMVFLTSIPFASISVKNYREKDWKKWKKFIKKTKKFLLTNSVSIFIVILWYAIIYFGQGLI